jgi:hypothetical protein
MMITALGREERQHYTCQVDVYAEEVLIFGIKNIYANDPHLRIGNWPIHSTPWKSLR